MNNGSNRRPEMTPEQRAMYEARKKAYIEKKMREQAEAEKRLRRRMPIYITIFAATLLLITVILALIISSALNKDTRDGSYTYVIGEEKSEVQLRGSLFYIDMKSLKGILTLTESGSGKTLRYTVKGSKNNYAEFTDGSATVKVNDMSVNMPGAAEVGSDACLVPLDTVSSIFTGITVTQKSGKITIELKQIVNENGGKEYEPITILAKSTDPVSMLISFITDLSEYEQYMDPADRDAFLVLASKTSALGESYVPADLTALPSDIISRDDTLYLNLFAAKALQAMISEMRADGYSHIFVTSAYRDYAYQRDVLYEPRVRAAMEQGLSREQAEALVLKETAAPGTSEHQTGLCADLYDDRYDALTNPFASALTIEWLNENAWKFGFILRYPQGKEEVTGYSYESWHFRFVGRYHAQKIYTSGLTLDEYLEAIGK